MRLSHRNSRVRPPLFKDVSSPSTCSFVTFRSLGAAVGREPIKFILLEFVSYIYATDPRGPKCLAMYWRCSGGNGCRYRTCGPTRKLTRGVLPNLRENLRGSITDASPNIQWCIGRYSESNRCYIGYHLTMYLNGDGRWSFGEASGCNGDVLTMSWRCLDDVMAMVWSLVESRDGVIVMCKSYRW